MNIQISYAKNECGRSKIIIFMSKYKIDMFYDNPNS